MRILLAIDSSEPSQIALCEMMSRPWPPQTHVDVLTAIEPAHLWEMTETIEAVNENAKNLVDQAAQRLSSRGLLVKSMVVSGDAKRAILDRANEHDYDFVVVGSHGGPMLTRFLLGNVAATVARYAPCSVEIIRRRAGEPAEPREIVPPRRLLLATDGSESSQAAARSIAVRPWPDGSEVKILSVVEFVFPSVPALLEPPSFRSEELKARREEGMRHAENAILAARTILDATPLKISESLSVLFDPPRDVILREAREWGAHLIVVGSHGREGVERFLLGSVSESVATHATCSVELIRA